MVKLTFSTVLTGEINPTLLESHLESCVESFYRVFVTLAQKLYFWRSVL